jgi:NhaP-type Na+/H+ or K+/H+ antiporter
VLATDVEVGEPTSDPGSEDEIRFALTSEAGLNDGLAFPFVNAALLLVVAGSMDWVGGWVAWELVGKVWLWATAIFAIILSVVVHGVLATPVMNNLEQRRERLARDAAT